VSRFLGHCESQALDTFVIGNFYRSHNRRFSLIPVTTTPPLTVSMTRIERDVSFVSLMPFLTTVQLFNLSDYESSQ
jgi:hypothetical protein